MTHPILLPPSPRRTDDAFARAVASDVAAARQARSPWRILLAIPATAGVAVAIALSVGGPRVEPVSGSALVALVEAEVDASDAEFALDDVDDATLLAFAGAASGADLAPAFAFADLDGSTDQDLDAVEAALDRAIRNL